MCKITIVFCQYSEITCVVQLNLVDIDGMIG